MLTNLLSNAAKFTPRAGAVTVTFGQRDGVVELAVTDTGKGIPAQEQPRVFDRFFRGVGSQAGGSGIGLAVAAKLVAAHGGEISVHSEPGYGSRFLVRLPRRAQRSRRHSSNLHSRCLASILSERTQPEECRSCSVRPVAWALPSRRRWPSAPA